eukprot:scaffold10943_cov102-Isochrysis_galbana.AAC.5
MCRDASTSTCGAHRTGDGLRRNCCVRVAACACGARVACAGAWPRFTKREPMCRHTCDSTSCACAGWRRLLRRLVAPGQWHEVASTIWRRGIDSRTQLVPSSRRWPAWRRVKAGGWATACSPVCVAPAARCTASAVTDSTVPARRAPTEYLAPKSGHRPTDHRRARPPGAARRRMRGGVHRPERSRRWRDEGPPCAEHGEGERGAKLPPSATERGGA